MTLFAFNVLGLIKLLVAGLGGYVVLVIFRMKSRRSRTTALPGPPSPSFIFGVNRIVEDLIGDSGEIYEKWAQQYGAAYSIGMPLGKTRIVLFDPKAIAFFTTHDTTTFLRPSISREAIARLVGRGLLWADQEDHKRQRKALSPAFSNTAVRNVTPVFFDSAYKVKAALESILQTSEKGAVEIDITTWLNHITFDSIGIAGFGHDFGTLEGKHSDALDRIEAFSKFDPSAFQIAMILLAWTFPILLKVPSEENDLSDKFNQSLDAIATDLFKKSRDEKAQEGGSSAEDKSIIGLLLKAEGSRLSKQEVIDQMKLLMVAGYDTTAISMTWAFIELCRHQEVQAKLREELEQLSGRDPTYEELNHGLPYLDAIVHEILRLHGPADEIIRVSGEDQAIPLAKPLRLPSGKEVDHITVCKGQWVSVSVHGVNQSVDFWGPDAKEFNPERWLNPDGLPEKAQEVQGHRHLLSFSDGPRFCIGRMFALTEFKAVLTVLIRTFAFEFRDGPTPEFENRRAVIPRPGMKGEPETRIPLIVKRLD